MIGSTHFTMTDVDRYIAQLPHTARATLNAMRVIIKEEAPDAEELMSYGIPSYKQLGMVVGIGATKNNCGLYLYAGQAETRFKAELDGYKIEKGMVQFPADEPLAESLLRAIVRFRVGENKARREPK